MTAELPQTADDFRLMANNHFAQKDYETALCLYSECIKLEPLHAIHYCNRSACYLALSTTATLAEMSQHMEVIRLEDNDNDNDTTVDAAELAKQDALRAVELLTAIDDNDTQIDALHYKAYFRLGKALMELRDYEECEKQLSRFLSNNNDLVDKELESYQFQVQKLLDAAKNPPKASIKDFTIEQELGEGNFSRVCIARHNVHTSKMYGLKIIEKSKAEKLGKREHPNVYNEIQMERRVLLEKLIHPRHKCVIKMHAAFQDYYNLYYLMDLHYDFTNKKQHELWDSMRFERSSVGAHHSMIRFQVAEVVEAIQYCHSKGIVHRDLKTENLMIQDNGHICLIDFGTAKDLIDRDLNGPEFVGTPDYMSPEAVKGDDKVGKEVNGVAMDYWALGITLFTLYVGNTTFSSPSPYLSFLKIRRGIVPKPDCIPDDAYDLISRLLVQDPSKRLGCNDAGPDGLRNHPYFQNDPVTQDIGKLNEREFGIKVPSLIDLCVRTVALQIKNDGLSWDDEKGDTNDGGELKDFPEYAAKKLYPSCGNVIRSIANVDIHNNGSTCKSNIEEDANWPHLRSRIMHCLDRMFLLGNLRVRRRFFSNKVDRTLERVRAGTRDFMGYSWEEQRKYMKEREPIMPRDDPMAQEINFVCLSSPLFREAPPVVTDKSSGGVQLSGEGREKYIKSLKDSIRKINRIRPSFIVVSVTVLAPDVRKLLGKVSETIPIMLNSGEKTPVFSFHPGIQTQGMGIHIGEEDGGGLDNDSFAYIKQELELKETSKSPLFIFTNLDPLQMTKRDDMKNLIYRLAKAKTLFVLGLTDNDDYIKKNMDIDFKGDSAEVSDSDDNDDDSSIDSDLERPPKEPTNKRLSFIGFKDGISNIHIIEDLRKWKVSKIIT